MQAQTALLLNRLNVAFYERVAASFSETRQAPWPGWRRCLEDAQGALGGVRRARVLDLACGNLRFARFLADGLPEAHIDYVGVDASASLPRQGAPRGLASCTIERRDVVGGLLGAREGEDAPDGLFDLAVSFGFLHHVPTMAAREALMRALVGSVRPGGIACVSLWRFATHEGLARKALATTQDALGALGLSPGELDAGDYLLGWQGERGVWRYCHSFSDEDARALASCVADKAQAIDRFCCDGRTGDLNGYLVLQRA